MPSDRTERVGCYRWKREGCEDTFWSEYPATTEQFEKSEATILFWDVVTEMGGIRMNTDGTERWWSDKTPSLRERIGALTNVFLSGRFEHELRSAVAARPRTRPMGEDNFVGIDLYKIWFVLHHDEHGDDRTTNLYIRKIGDTYANIDRIHESSIQAGLLPLQNDDWQYLQPDMEQSDGDLDG
ncbi:hypothetical protein [Natronorubrum sp. FCH18a]|uniref:hypothetical protein n=1 Tax=Natronorubrum sp. FCH18a TaxID=3447018 RepID=UPI003F50E5BF